MITPLTPLTPLTPMGFVGISAAAAKALLEYSPTFQYHTNATGDMVVANKGTGGTSNDLLLYSGRALQLGATNDLPIPTFANGYVTYFDFETNEFAQAATDGTDYTFNSQTINNILVHHTAFTADDLTILNSNPNLMAKLAMNGSSIPELSMTLQGDEQWYPCSELETPYVVDLITPLGADIATHSENFGLINVTKTVNGSMVTFAANAGSTTHYSYSRLSTTDPAFLTINVPADDYYKLTFDGYGNGYVQIFGWSCDSRMFLTTTRKTYSCISKSSGNNSNYISFHPNTDTASITIDVASIKVEKISASEVSNYTETIRTNVNQNQKGLQTSCLQMDEIGIPLAYVEDALNWHGVEYGDCELNLSTLPKFWLEEIVDGVIYQHDYDGTNLTTYTDGTAGTPAAHTPENVNYTLGRGVYPTLSTDPTVQDAIPYFAVFSDDYDIYDQSKRYTYLQGV